MSARRTVIRTAADAVALIREERARQGVPWAQLADKAQLAHTTLCNWAYGTRMPNLETALMALSALGLEVSVKPIRKGEGQHAEGGKALQDI